ncbi:nucleotide sugar dehydrogenase [Methanogenium marinum]|uniref:UDP-N-acetyl-D-mannosamine dehydrogenase n=1 Tax=Methanogenium marinum TaxID=348610 RepID=A0A9Q4KRD5_9EURY|nr:nucleotide sugar dehydrogenase [Methanogenium marinum]MDE4907277.1 nucleotide sugar dehydrogenase [Methanogenium marinum]
MQNLLTKIKDHDANIGVIGLGYVGLPLAIEYSKKFSVIGFDVNSEAVKSLQSGRSHIQDVPDQIIATNVNKSFFPTDDPAELKNCDFLIICVPTPLTEERLPDLTYIKSACGTIAGVLREGQFVILESTTYPGTTEEVVIPILEESGLKAGIDFGVAYSPERIDPGNKQFTVDEVPKVVGGMNIACTEIAAALYGSIIEEIIPVRDMHTAESVKMMENIFRNVNIALVNEMALIFERMGIDTWEVVDAAATKPYGFMPFYPGPGIGGHCIPLDPFYMSYKAKKYGFIPRFIETSGEINEFMKMHAVNLVEKGLKQVGKRIYGAKVTVMGLAYKKNINDPRESPSIKIIEELVRLGAKVQVYDPYVPSLRTCAGVFTSATSINEALDGAECALFLTDHDVFREISLETMKEVMAAPVVVDGKNMFDGGEGIIYLGIGKGMVIP